MKAKSLEHQFCCYGLFGMNPHRKNTSSIQLMSSLFSPSTVRLRTASWLWWPAAAQWSSFQWMGNVMWEWNLGGKYEKTIQCVCSQIFGHAIYAVLGLFHASGFIRSLSEIWQWTASLQCWMWLLQFLGLQCAKKRRVCFNWFFIYLFFLLVEWSKSHHAGVNSEFSLCSSCPHLSWLRKSECPLWKGPLPVHKNQ